MGFGSVTLQERALCPPFAQFVRSSVRESESFQTVSLREKMVGGCWSMRPQSHGVVSWLRQLLTSRIASDLCFLGAGRLPANADVFTTMHLREKLVRAPEPVPQRAARPPQDVP